MAKKSRIRIVGKKIILMLHLLVSLLLLYPIYIQPLPLIWINGFLTLTAPYLIVIEILFFIFWLIAKPLLSLISVGTLGLAWTVLNALFAWHPGSVAAMKKKGKFFKSH